MLLIIICYKYENACSKCFRLRQKNINVFVRTQKDESGCKRICVFPPLLINFVVALVSAGKFVKIFFTAISLYFITCNNFGSVFRTFESTLYWSYLQHIRQMWLQLKTLEITLPTRCTRTAVKEYNVNLILIFCLADMDSSNSWQEQLAWQRVTSNASISQLFRIVSLWRLLFQRSSWSKLCLVSVLFIIYLLFTCLRVLIILAELLQTVDNVLVLWFTVYYTYYFLKIIFLNVWK